MTRQNRKPLTGEDRDRVRARVLEMHSAGATRARMAAEIGRHPSMVDRLLAEAGVPRRKNAPALTGSAREAARSRLAQMKGAKATRAQMAAETGLSRTTVDRLLREAGVTRTNAPSLTGAARREEGDRLLERYSSGVPQAQLAAETGRYQGTVSLLISEARQRRDSRTKSAS
ncbi:helix-turn-helix domain-containing protein [Streptomyces xiamenensis]|uniref:helix-turn-helix domain-containing protein n=1 Tax=Streptomyces xiamenensis TaxID=408015 RepID=UPI0036F008B4